MNIGQKEAQKKAIKRYMAKLRLQAIAKLGGRCSNPECLVPGGCTDVRCLQIDHVHGNGAKLIKILGQHAMYKQIINYGDNGGYYQLLCANCNWIKRYERDEVRKY